MTARGAAHRLTKPRRRTRLPAPHWPSVRGRARADAGPLLLVAAVVAVVSLLAGAAPPLLRATSDEAFRDTIREAGADAEVLARSTLPYDDGPDGGRIRYPQLAADVDALRDRALLNLDRELRPMLRPGVAMVGGPSLDVTDGSVLRTFQFTYLSGERGPVSDTQVTWVRGKAPGASVPDDDKSTEVPYGSPPWTVQVGLSEANAAALKVGPGDRLQLKDKRNNSKDVRVSGVFRPADGADPVWRLAPWLLQPLSGQDGIGLTRLGGLLSSTSLPDARLAVDYDEMDRTVHFEPIAEAFTAARAREVTATLVTLQATSASSSSGDESLQWYTRLGLLLRGVQVQVNAASAQASVLLAGLVAGAVLVLMLAAALLAARRSGPLAAARRRGASLPALATELLLESVAVAVPATLLGLLAAQLAAPGVSWSGALPVLVAAVVAGPAAGVATAARATRDKRVPANRSARDRIRRTVALRRIAVEAGVVLAAAGALVALRQRGIVPVLDSRAALAPWSDSGGSALSSAAPALGVITGAIVLLRLMPAAMRLVLRRALRSRRPMAVFGAAQAVATASRALPLLVMVSSIALATFALTFAATTGRGLTDSSWRTVGGDARLDVSTAVPVDVPALVQRMSAAPGVEQVVPAQVIDGIRITTDDTLTAPRLVIVDSAAFRRLVAAIPLAGRPDVSGLGPASGGAIPALVRSRDDSLRPGMRLTLPRDDGVATVPPKPPVPPVVLRAVGVAPPVGDRGDAVIVDAAAMTAAGVPVVPNTVWMIGPGSDRAAAGLPGVNVVSRAEVLDERRDAPLTAGLLRLAWIAAGVLAVLGLIGLALGAAASAPQRWLTLARLRTLGVRPADGRWVATGELLPAALAAAIGGPLLGLLLAWLTFGSLALRLMIGLDADPPLTVAWWGIALLVAALPAGVALVVRAESVVRRRQGLGELLRVGG